jgi:hypothetical protein
MMSTKGKLRRWLPALIVCAWSGLTQHVVLAEDADDLQSTTSEDKEGPYGPEINDADPESSIPDQGGLNRDPIATGYMLMEMSLRAEKAEGERDWPKALRYYRALGKAVPERSVSFSRICNVYIQMSETDLAIEACRKATRLQGVTVNDFLRLATLLLERTPEGVGLPPDDVKEIEAVVRHLRKDNPEGQEPQILLCRLAVKLGSVPGLRECVDKLEQALPHDATTLTFKFSLALLEKDLSKAHEVIDEARQAELPAEAIGLMQKELSTRARQKLTRQLATGAAVVGVPFAAATALLALWRRRRPAVVRA